MSTKEFDLHLARAYEQLKILRIFIKPFIGVMDLPSPFKVPSVPGTPLYALSPERINQQRIPQSPSHPGHLSESERKHHRNSSDVRSKVEFLNSLAGQNPPQSPTRQNTPSAYAALQRANLGREEAEAQLSTASSQLQESQSRELRISQRVESLMEELQTLRERQVHERQVFEKEVRKARKEAFKASSIVVKAQEDLKECRAEIKTAKAEAQHERNEKEKARQEAFERAYALAGLMEEMEVVREQLKSVQQERDTALMELKANVRPANLTAVNIDAQMQTTSADADFSSIMEVLPETEESETGFRILNLKEELDCERRWREQAEQEVHMLQMECQFMKCACRVAEARGERFVHDKVYDQRIRAISVDRKRKAAVATQPKAVKQVRLSEKMDESLEPISALEDMTQVIVESNAHQQQLFSFSTSTGSNPHAGAPILRPGSAYQHRDLFDLSPPKNRISRPATALGTMTPQSPIRVVPDSPKPRPRTGSNSNTPTSNHKRSRTAGTVPLKEPASPLRHSVRAHARSPSFSATPAALTPGFKFPGQLAGFQRHTQTVSTTTRVPLRGDADEDVFSPIHLPGTPGTPVSREVALAQIRARRDRARSVNLKSTSLSSGKGIGGATPGSAKRGINAVVFAEGGKGRRDVSQASAPGRI